MDQWGKFGFTDADFRRLVRGQLYRDKLLELFVKETATTTEQVWARHILVTDEAKAQEVLTRLKNGEDFGKIASEISEDTGSKENNGDLGWFGKGTMVQAFEDAVFNLKIGEISQLVKTDYGYHIIQLLGKENRARTSDEIKTAAEESFQTWLNTANAAEDVKKFDNWTRYPVTEPTFTPPVIPTSVSDIPGFDTTSPTPVQ